VGHHPGALALLQALVGGYALSQQLRQRRVEISRLGQVGSGALDHQRLAVGAGHGIALGIVEHRQGVGRNFVPGQRGAELREGQVGGDQCAAGRAAGEGSANLVSREKHIGRGGDGGRRVAGLDKPRALAGVVAVVGIVPTLQQVQRRVVEQRLRMRHALGIMLDAPDLQLRARRRL
jgi:hypothetical protein